VGHAVQRDKAGITCACEHDRADRDLHPIQLALHGAGAAPTEEDEKCGHEGTLAVLLAEELDPRRMARGAGRLSPGSLRRAAVAMRVAAWRDGGARRRR